jgi:cell division protein ZapA (FtsZ GTPase activity inhibitor)
LPEVYEKGKINKLADMPLKKLPETDEERLEILQAIMNQDEMSDLENKIIPIADVQDMRTFLISYEGALFILNQSIEDEKNAQLKYNELFLNAQLYISHFLQVLFLTVIRKEIKAELLSLYGFENGDTLVLPDLSTEEAVLKWGENLIKGESERIYRGGIPLYNPAIAKVKVHFELFKDEIQSLSIYKKNSERWKDKLEIIREKATDLIWNIWKRVEEKYGKSSIGEQTAKYRAYKIQYGFYRGEQLNVFD